MNRNSSPLAPLLGVIDICTHWVFCRNWILNHFYLNLFLKSVFKSAFNPKLNVICLSINISTVSIFWAPKLHYVETYTYVLGDFFVQNSIPNNFCLKLLWMRCVFLAAFSSTVNVLFLLSTILYFNHINLSSPLASLYRDIDIHARGLICTKFNSEQLLFEAFVDVTHIFGNIEP